MKTITAETNYAVAPGAYLKEWMLEQHLRADHVALAMGMSESRLRGIFSGELEVNTEIAVALKSLTGISERTWLGYEALYREDLARLQKENAVLATDQDAVPGALTDEERVSATFTLAIMSDFHPELKKAEAEARLKLASAIQAWDQAETAKVPGQHTLQEQAAVNRATTAYALALANLLRGETEE